jgi:4-amino-4-deoxy-L-arabinose transferase-like glycosyltransferase
MWRNVRERWKSLQPSARRRVLYFLLIFVLAFSVRFFTFQFMRAHLNDAGWFQYGSYQVFDKRASNILDGRESAFWIDDPTRTDLVQYPPAFPLWVAAIYRVTGEHSMYAVQRVQWFLDCVLSLVLVTGVAVTAYGWRAGVAAAFFTALSPLLALYGSSPAADAPTTWFVLAGVWLLLIAAKRRSLAWVFGAGLMLGAACWFRVNPLYLAFAWALALLLFARAEWKRRIALSAAVTVVALLVVSPIVIRNYLVFPDFTPTGGTIGVNLWEGLGETELGRSNGFLYGDGKMVEREREKMGLPPDFPLEPFWPDGIRRDRERAREAISFIKQHPVWYAGVMLRRMWGMLKIFGEPVAYSGSAGINVTSQKCLPTEWQGGVVALFVNLLGIAQSIARYLLLPLAAFGVWLALRKDFLMAALILTTVLYYLVPGTAAHTELRYVMPMHALLTVFAGIGVCRLGEIVLSRRQTTVMRKKKELEADG